MGFVVEINNPLARFFAASLALHVLAFLWFARPGPKLTPAPQDPIKVSLLPEPSLPEQLKPLETSKSRVKSKSAPREPAPRRASKVPAMVAKKSSPASAEKRSAQSARAKARSTPRETSAPELSREAPPPPPLQPLPERTVIVQRPLPSLKDLLPSATYFAEDDGGPGQTPVSLNTTDPKYITYVGKIRQSIELEWQYPEIALRYGLHGKLALEFTILGNGQLDGLRLLRSSGSSLLDDEALRAIKAAAPFPAIPPWIKPNPLRITATMEYRDSRLDYRFAR
jgi:periplasmic protein TonB